MQGKVLTKIIIWYIITNVLKKEEANTSHLNELGKGIYKIIYLLFYKVEG